MNSAGMGKQGSPSEPRSPDLPSSLGLVPLIAYLAVAFALAPHSSDSIREDKGD